MEEQYYCFCDSKRKWLKLFKKGFQHCFVAIKYDNVFVILEDSLDGFFPSMMLAEDFFRFTKQNKCSILIKEQVNPAKKKFGIWYWAPTCVNFVKAVGNLRTRAQTPWQLYKYLLKKGAQKWVEQSDKLQVSKQQRKPLPQKQNKEGNFKKKKMRRSNKPKN